MTGPGAIGAGALRSLSAILPPRGYFRGDLPAEFCLSTPYVYDNNPTNYGGIVPSGGLVVDGYAIPAGTYVVQFSDISGTDFYMTDNKSVLFRGCRGRGPQSQCIGYWNCAVGCTGRFYVFYCDLGGLGSASVNYSCVPMKIAQGTSAIAYRNRIQFMCCGLQFNILSGGEAVENFITDLTTFGGSDHLNGMTFNGGESCMLVKRNNIVISKFDTSGREVNQTDCISFFQDFGDFPGNGTNRDGTTGYIVDSNYVGGTGYCIYAGLNTGRPTTSVSNMKVTNNLATTSSYPTGGSFGPLTAEPPWGVQGNVKTNNVWADGPNAGQAF
jgi:hypothetical protein